MGEDWYNLLKPYLISKLFKSGLAKIYEDIDNGSIIVPAFPDIFRAFRECRLEEMHTVIMVDGPYTGITPEGKFVADGLAISSRDSIIRPPLLTTVLRAINDDVFQGQGALHNIYATRDLKQWANNGILLLNTSLTARYNEPGSHDEVWIPFMSQLMRRLIEVKQRALILFMGKEAREYKSLFSVSTFEILECEHPSKCNYDVADWNYGKLFTHINTYQDYMNNIQKTF